MTYGSLQKEEKTRPARPCWTSLYKQFHDTLSSILNTHAPLKTKSVSPKPPNPWITLAI